MFWLAIKWVVASHSKMRDDTENIDKVTYKEAAYAMY